MLDKQYVMKTLKLDDDDEMYVVSKQCVIVRKNDEYVSYFKHNDELIQENTYTKKTYEDFIDDLYYCIAVYRKVVEVDTTDSEFVYVSFSNNYYLINDRLDIFFQLID